MATLPSISRDIELDSQSSLASPSPVVFGAPIKKITDSRLLGTSLANIFNSCCDWTKITYDSINSKRDQWHVTLFKSAQLTTKILIVILPILFSPFFAVLGNVLRAGHFYYLNEDEKKRPPAVRKNGLSLDQFPVRQYAGDKPTQLYHWTDARHKDAIMRSGFRAERCQGGMLGKATYAAVDPDSTQMYGNTQFTLNFNLNEDEILYTDISSFMNIRGIRIYEDEDKKRIQALFLANGYKAVHYRCAFEDSDRTVPAVAVYDDSCISIAGVRPKTPPTSPVSTEPAKAGYETGEIN